MADNTIPLGSLVALATEQSSAAFIVSFNEQQVLQQVTTTLLAYSEDFTNCLWATPREACGDGPRQYNFKFLMALLTAKLSENIKRESIRDFPVPKLEFSTAESVRRSMTLNSMRMSTEYFTSGSARVLQLVEQRLAAGQADVVHDLLVYLMQHVLDLRTEARELRLLRAESVAAYLGIDVERVSLLFLTSQLSAKQISKSITSGAAGAVRRNLDVYQLVDSQVSHLVAILDEKSVEEEQTVELIRAVVDRLYH